MFSHVSLSWQRLLHFNPFFAHLQRFPEQPVLQLQKVNPWPPTCEAFFAAERIVVLEPAVSFFKKTAASMYALFLQTVYFLQF